MNQVGAIGWEGPHGTLSGPVWGPLRASKPEDWGKESLEAPGGARASQSSTGIGPGVCRAARHALQACAEGLRSGSRVIAHIPESGTGPLIGSTRCSRPVGAYVSWRVVA